MSALVVDTWMGFNSVLSDKDQALLRLEPTKPSPEAGRSARDPEADTSTATRGMLIYLNYTS